MDLRFSIVCEIIDNTRLMQPHGMIPYTLHKHFGYHSTVVSYKNGEYSYLNNELFGLKIHLIKHIFYKKAKWPFFVYLLLNARNIDILMVYNVKKRPIYYGLLYKLLNPGGFLYAKGDTALEQFNFYVENALLPYKLYMRKLGKIFLSQCNAVSVENTKTFSNNSQVTKDKLIYMPCGLDRDIITNLGLRFYDFDKKENIVLHVARMGAYQKNSEHLLDSIALLPTIPDDWKFVLIGSQTQDFIQYYKSILSTHPHLINHIEFIDHISSKKKLYEYYNRSKIFCLPSRIESFGNVLSEAMHFGVVIAANETIPSVQDLVNNGSSGVTFSITDKHEMSTKLLRLMNDQDQLRAMSTSSVTFAKDHLQWKHIVEPLHNKIIKHYQ